MEGAHYNDINNSNGDPLSPDRTALHENDMNGIVALLQLSAGKKSARKRRDAVSSPSYLGSPDKRSRLYSPGGTALSPSARVMHATSAGALSTSGLKAVTNVAGVERIPGVVQLHELPELPELPEWTKEAKERVERLTQPVDTHIPLVAVPDPDSDLGRRFSIGYYAPTVSVAGVARQTSRGAVSKRAVAREARRAVVRAKVLSCLQGEREGERGAPGEGAPLAASTHEQPPTKNSTIVIDGKKDDAHGSLVAFAGREFLCSDLDAGYYGEGRTWMDKVLEDIGFDTKGDVMLTKAEWTALRSVMKGQGQGGVRRLSEQFMLDSRAELLAHREREVQSQAFSFTVGQAVTAVHPVTREVQDGVVLALAGKESCRVQFDRVDLGVLLVSNSMLRRVNKPAAAVGIQKGSVQQLAQHPMAMSLSSMLGAFMNQSTGAMRTPSPEKLPNYGQFGLPGQSPTQLYVDRLVDPHALKTVKEEGERDRGEGARGRDKAADPADGDKAADNPLDASQPEIAFDEDAIKGMDAVERRQHVLDEMYAQLKAACKQDDLQLIEQRVAHLCSTVSRELGDLRDNKSLMNQPDDANYEYRLHFLDASHFERLHRGIEAHIKQLMAMLMMLERTPALYGAFVRGLELIKNAPAAAAAADDE